MKNKIKSIGWFHTKVIPILNFLQVLIKKQGYFFASSESEVRQNGTYLGRICLIFK